MRQDPFSRRCTVSIDSLQVAVLSFLSPPASCMALANASISGRRLTGEFRAVRPLPMTLSLVRHRGGRQ